MPLHLICECCKCKQSFSQDLWSISIDNSYSDQRYVCSHFDVEIKHESSIGFWGIGWKNKITITANYKPDSSRKVIIDKTFDSYNTEYQNYSIFDNKVVFHARISDYKDNYPNIGFSRQEDIEKSGS